MGFGGGKQNSSPARGCFWDQPVLLISLLRVQLFSLIFEEFCQTAEIKDRPIDEGDFSFLRPNYLGRRRFWG